MDIIPIFVFHLGNPTYLKIMIQQAEKFGNSIYLLGDESNRNACQNWYSAAEYTPDDFQDFLKVFVQMSDYPLDFDVNCFKRFFIMKEFMKKNNINKMFFADSDLLIFSNISETFADCRYKASLSIPERQDNYRWTAQGHSSFWTLEYLEDFLTYTKFIYSEKIDILQQKYNYHLDNAIKGGVCDMTLLYLWSREKEGIVNTAKIRDATVFDHCIGSASNYKDNEYKFNRLLQMKHVEFKNGIPFCLCNNKKIFMKTLHCQGSAKSLMPYIIEEKPECFGAYIKRYKEIFIRLTKK